MEAETSSPVSNRDPWIVAILLILAVVSLLYCRTVLVGFGLWGNYDWDQHLFYNATVYRALTEFGEIPLWNPWYLGGNPQLGNPQIQFPTPMTLLDLLAGPIVGMKLKIVLHHWIGLVGMFWLGRRLGMSRTGALLTSAGFMLSNWYALHLYIGHSQFMSMAYVPWFLGCLHLAKIRHIFAVPAALLLALMVFEGGIYTVIFTTFVAGLVSLAWSVQNRSWKPLVALVLALSLGAGLSAFKAIPVVTLLKANPRLTALGGNAWKTAEEQSNRTIGQEPAQNPPEVAPRSATAPVPRSKLALIQQFLKVFFSRDQRGNTRYFVQQGFAWQEYGTYMGPVIALVLIFSPLVFKRQWPWMLAAIVCFAISMGNFARWSPWAILHWLPVMNNARVPTRFLMPFALATSIVAGFTFDALRAKIASGSTGGKLTQTLRSRIEILGLIVLMVCAIDMTWVGNRSFEGAFNQLPPKLQEKSPNIITIRGVETNMLLPMLENRSTKEAYEEAHIPVNVVSVEEPAYRGEAGFIASKVEISTAATRPSPASVEITAWTPNTVTLHVNAGEPGWVFVNRNWDQGWQASSPYLAVAKNGLIAAEVAAGEHTIHFYYRPTGVWIGAALSLMSLIAAGLWVWRDSRRARPLVDARTGVDLSQDRAP